MLLTRLFFCQIEEMTELNSDAACGEGTMTERYSSLPGIVRTVREPEGVGSLFVRGANGRSYIRLSMAIACRPNRGREDAAKKKPPNVLRSYETEWYAYGQVC